MRTRTSWNLNEIATRSAAMNRQADPYAMNQDHLKQQPAADAYVTGDPSTFAEDVTPNNWSVEYAGGQTRRDEIGLPEVRKDTFNHPEKTAAQRETLLIRKADVACKVSRKLLGKNASDEAVEAQSVSFLAMPDEQLINTFNRLAAEDPTMLAGEQQQQQAGQQQEQQAGQQEQQQQAGQQQQPGQQGQQQAGQCAPLANGQPGQQQQMAPMAQQAPEDELAMAAQQCVQAFLKGGPNAKNAVQALVRATAKKAALIKKKATEQQQQQAGQQQQQQAGQQEQQQQAGQQQDPQQAPMQQQAAPQQQMPIQQQAAPQQQVPPMAQQQMPPQQQAPVAQGQDQVEAEVQQMINEAMQEAPQQQMPVQANQGQQQGQGQSEQQQKQAEDQLLQSLLTPGTGAGGMAGIAEMDIELAAPQMDVGEVVFAAEDDVLRTLFATEESQAQEQVQQGQQGKQANIRTAALRTVGTQPRGGVARIGGAGAPASRSEDISRLSSMWESAPDVRDAFGLK